MFHLIFSKEKPDRVFHLKVCGISACHSSVVWGTPIEYMHGKQLVDTLNESKLPEDELFDAVLAFLTEMATWIS